MLLVIFVSSTLLFFNSNNILVGVIYKGSNNIQWIHCCLYFWQKLEGLTYNELKLNIRKVIKEIPKETYKNLLISSYKRDGVYVKKSSRKSSKKLKNYK